MPPAKCISICCLFACLFALTSQPLAYTRDEVIERDMLRCGVSTGIPGFSSVNGDGSWRGLDVDICRAVAAAVLRDADKVEYIPLLPKERATALLTGEIDILSRNYSWDFTRDSALNINFVGVTFYDLQGFLVNRRVEVEKSILEMKEFSVCLQAGTNYGEYLEDYLQQSEIRHKKIVSETPDQIIQDFEQGRCEVVTGGRAQLQGIRSKMTDPAATTFLPEVIANIPLGPAVRHGDDVWFDIVKWSVFAMINGEELELTSANVDSVIPTSNRAVMLFLGQSGSGGKGLGLANDWAYQIIKQVGNYGEVFQRNLGSSSALKLERGLNNLWSNGGILFAPPLR